jgi:Tfp pilus assembly ATPase PilU
VTNMTAWLEALVGARGSDLHVKVGSTPRMRVDGHLVNLEGPVITSDMAENLLTEVIRPDLYDEFQRRNEADFAYSLAGVGRFRVNAFRQRGSVGLVLRRVQEGALSIEDLGLPPVIARLAEEPRGLVLVTGPTGSGKTTCSRPSSSARCGCRWRRRCAASSASGWSAATATAAGSRCWRSWSTPGGPRRRAPTPSGSASWSRS